jgi:hypothetical protein
MSERLLDRAGRRRSPATMPIWLEADAVERRRGVRGYEL